MPLDVGKWRRCSAEVKGRIKLEPAGTGFAEAEAMLVAAASSHTLPLTATNPLRHHQYINAHTHTYFSAWI